MVVGRRENRLRGGLEKKFLERGDPARAVDEPLKQSTSDIERRPFQVLLIAYWPRSLGRPAVPSDSSKI